jgi:PKHD-type hydroxylase
VRRLSRYVSEAFGVELVDIETQDPLVYRYDVGPGFVVHHDEVTAIELTRARANGQPVIGGDVTVAGALSQPETYGGGELFFTEPQVAEFKASQGAAVTFPATRSFMHGVRPVTHGHRYALLVRLNVAEPVSGEGS